MLDKLIDIMNHLPPPVAGALMAILTSVIRVLYDDKETKPQRIIVESLLCGALSLTATYGITALGLNIHWAVFMGGVIGYLGPNAVREYGVKFLNKKTDSIK